MKTLIFILAFACCAFGCESPEIRGLKLGMNRAALLKMFSGAREIQRNQNSFVVKPNNLKGFESVVSVGADFAGEKLFKLQITYEKSAANWTDARQFAKNLSENLNLPANLWEFQLEGYGILTCRDFTIEVYSDINKIILNDLILEKKMKEDEEIKRKSFKP